MQSNLDDSTTPAALPSWLLLTLLVAAVLAAYSNSFSGPQVFDDVGAIANNRSIRDLTNLPAIFNPPNSSGTTVNGRPLLNLTLAINYAVGGTQVTGYHVANLLIHLVATFALFGVSRRLLAAGRSIPVTSAEATTGGALIAGFWALHPLQTQAVTYIVQRAESLVGVFLLLTLYCFIRSQQSPRARLWLIGSVLCGLLGVASKEVIAVVPLLVLLCDRTFFARSFAGAWRARRAYYLGLFALWLPLGWLIFSSGGRGGTVGFGLGGVTWWSYLLTQADAITRYLSLAVWPNRLVFDYGTGVAGGFAEVAPQFVFITLLVLATVFALWRWPVAGFLGAWFFLILGPSSSVVPIVTETMAEHRMYLPLAALTAAAGLGLLRLSRLLWIPAAIGILAALAGLTWQRNIDYQTEISLWRSSVAHYPQSSRAQNNYGEMLSRQRRYPEAITHFREAVRLQPNYLDALCNLGSTLHRIGQTEEGMFILKHLVQSDGKKASVQSAYGAALYREGHRQEAKEAFLRALAIDPSHPDSNNNLAVLYNDANQPADAVRLLETALGAQPDYADALYNLGNSLAQLGRLDEAAARLRRALALDPGRAEAHNNLGVIHLQQGRVAEATVHFEQAVRLSPIYADAHNNLGVMLLERGEAKRAIELFTRALQIRPNYADAQRNLQEAKLRSTPPPKP